MSAIKMTSVCNAATNFAKAGKPGILLSHVDERVNAFRERAHGGLSSCGQEVNGDTRVAWYTKSTSGGTTKGYSTATTKADGTLKSYEVGRRASGEGIDSILLRVDAVQPEGISKIAAGLLGKQTSGYHWTMYRSNESGRAKITTGSGFNPAILTQFEQGLSQSDPMKAATAGDEQMSSFYAECMKFHGYCRMSDIVNA